MAAVMVIVIAIVEIVTVEAVAVIVSFYKNKHNQHLRYFVLKNVYYYLYRDTINMFRIEMC